jgi:hypothetical protein
MAVNNPFSGVTIGCPVDLLGEFKRTVLNQDAEITRSVESEEAEMTMRGQSDLVHTTAMNQGSISVAGSYGVEGVQKVTSAVSAYFGYSSAELRKQLNLVYEVVQYAGYEYIEFDELSPFEMLSALNKSPKDHAEEVFDLYNGFMTKLDQIMQHPYVKALEWSIPQIFDAFPNPAIDPKLDPKKIEAKHQRLKLLAEAVDAARDLRKQWGERASKFRENFGEGMVVGVLWGGIGQAAMTFQSTDQAAAWKYGGTSNFSYASDAASVAVEATYDASGSADTSKVTVECSYDYSGACVSDQVKGWAEKLNGKALSLVSDFKPLAAPALAFKKSLPKAPALKKPATVEKQTEKLTKNNVETAAKLATYDKAKKLFEDSNPGKKFDESINAFLDRVTNAKPKAGPMKQLKDGVASNRLSTQGLLTDK